MPWIDIIAAATEQTAASRQIAKTSGEISTLTTESAQNVIPEEISTLVKERPCEIDSKGKVHEAQQRCAQEDIPAYEVGRARGRYSESRL